MYAAGCAAVAIPAAAAPAGQRHRVAFCRLTPTVRCSFERNGRWQCCGCVSRMSRCSADSGSCGYSRSAGRRQCTGSCGRSCFRCFQLPLATGGSGYPGGVAGAARSHRAHTCISHPNRPPQSTSHATSAAACGACRAGGAFGTGAGAVSHPAVAVRCADARHASSSRAVLMSALTSRSHQPLSAAKSARVTATAEPAGFSLFGVGPTQKGL